MHECLWLYWWDERARASASAFNVFHEKEKKEPNRIESTRTRESKSKSRVVRVVVKFPIYFAFVPFEKKWILVLFTYNPVGFTFCLSQRWKTRNFQMFSLCLYVFVCCSTKKFIFLFFFSYTVCSFADLLLLVVVVVVWVLCVVRG